MSKRSTRRWSRLFVLFVLVFAGGTAWAVYALRITEIRVTGAETLPPSELVQASGLHTGERILWVRMSGAADRVRAYPGVGSVRVERSLPGTVVIRIVERVPLVRLDGQPELVADKDGVLFPYRVEAQVATLVGWRGKAKAGGRLDPVSRVVLDAMAEFPADLLRRARAVLIEDALTIRLDDDTEVRFGRPYDLVAKAQSALRVLEANIGTPLAYVDVRAPRAPVSLRRGLVTQTPQPEPSTGPSTSAPGPAPAQEPASAPEPTAVAP